MAKCHRIADPSVSHFPRFDHGDLCQCVSEEKILAPGGKKEKKDGNVDTARDAVG